MEAQRCTSRQIKNIHLLNVLDHPAKQREIASGRSKSMLSGYAGKIGWIDLSKGTVKVQDLEEDIARKYLGGKGLGAYLLYRHLKPNTDPLDPENIMIFVTGPLTGTNFPAVSRSGVITRSPLTGTFLDSYSGGFFGTQIKWAGYDALVIRGRAESPSYLLVEEEGISIRKADHLWGLSTSETERRLREDLSSKKGERTGGNVAKYVAGELRKRAKEIKVVPGENIRTVTPHKIVGLEKVELAIRVQRPIEKAELTVGGFKKKYRVISPTEVVKVTLQQSDLEAFWERGEMTVSCSERRKE